MQTERGIPWRSGLRCVLALTVLSCFRHGLAADVDGLLYVLTPAILDRGAPIAQSVGAECELQEVMGQQAYKYVNAKVRRTVTQVRDVKQAGEAKVVTVTILSAQGVGGGGWSGGKTLTVRADITQAGELVASKIFITNSRGGIAGAVSGTCWIFERIARVTADRMARWIPGALMTAAHAGPQGERRVAVQVPALVDPTAKVFDGIESECALPNLLANHVFGQIRNRYYGARILGAEGPRPTDKVLRLTILNTQVVPGGGFTGPKGITLQADVLENSRVVASNVFQRSGSTGTNAQLNTCAILEVVSVALGKEVAAWLPTATDVGSILPAAADEGGQDLPPEILVTPPQALMQAQSTAAGPVVAAGATATALAKVDPQASSASPPAPGMPAPGTKWKYGYRDQQYPGEETVFTVEVATVNVAKVSERVVVDGTGAVSQAVIDADQITFASRPLRPGTSFVELAPYARDIWKMARPAGYPGPAGAMWRVSTPRYSEEEVRVPAGTFKALRVEVNGASEAFGGSVVQATAARFVYVAWYSPELNRYVKIHHQTWSRQNIKLGDEVVQLVEYQPGR